MTRLLGHFLIWVLMLGQAVPSQAQVTTSGNLVPTPNHWTTGGQSITQSFAINQALAASGSAVRVQGFDWGYQYSLDAGGSVTSAVSITNAASQSIYSNSYTQTDAPTNGVQSNSFSYNLATATPAANLGSFNWLLSAQGAAVVFGSYSRARYTVDSLSDNMVFTSVNPAPQGASYSWSGFQIVNSFGGVSGGNIPGYKVATGEFAFGYNQGTINYAIAVNSVLSGSGIQVSGMQYGMEYYNQDFSRGTLSATFSLKNSAGATLQSYQHALPQTTSGWTAFDYAKIFATDYALTGLGNATMSITGKDDRWWAGYYGPMVRNPYIRLTYISDVCAVDPLSSPTCPGYAAALFTQQCTANPLYDAACPGYAAALFTQQCTANPLSNPACPGYAVAYQTQQCSINPLYSESCANYQTASSQCAANPLTASYCPNYQAASSQCAANPLSAAYCPGYQAASLSCAANSLSYSYCPGYQTALTVCTSNPLSNSLCAGYQAAVTACAANSLSYGYCPGYQTALAACTTNPLSNTLCSGYNTASQACSTNQLTYSYCPDYKTTLAACSTNSQSNSLCPGYSTTQATSGAANPVSSTKSTSEATVSLDSSGQVSATVSRTGSSVVDAAISAPTSTTSPAAPAAPVQLVSTPPAPAPAPAAAAPAAAPAATAPANNSASAGSQSSSGGGRSDSKPDNRNSSEVKAAVAQRAREEMKKAESATSFEAQVNVQQGVITSMGFVLGFDAYNSARLVDINALKMQRQYSRPVVDNRALLRQLSGASDRLHQDMVNQQYPIGE